MQRGVNRKETKAHKLRHKGEKKQLTFSTYYFNAFFPALGSRLTTGLSMSLRQIGRVICVELTEGCVLCAQLRACLLLLLISEPARKLVHLVSLISRRNSTVQHTYRYVALMQMWMLCSPVQTVSKSRSCRVFSCSTTLKKTMQEVKTQRNKSKGVRGKKKKGVKVQANQFRNHIAVTF